MGNDSHSSVIITEINPETSEASKSNIKLNTKNIPDKKKNNKISRTVINE